MVFRSTIADEQFYVDDDTFMAQDLLWLCRAARAGTAAPNPERPAA